MFLFKSMVYKGLQIFIRFKVNTQFKLNEYFFFQEHFKRLQ